MLLQYTQYKGVVNLDICEEGDAIMADKGFLISDFVLVVFQVSSLHLINKRTDFCHMKWKHNKVLPT